MADTYNIPQIPNNVTGAGALAVLNDALAQTENALNELASTVQTQNSKSAIIRQQVPIAADVNIGDLVYYDAAEAVFKRALAALRSTPGKQGESVEAPEARVEGMIVAKTDSAGNTGTLLQGGFYKDAACVNQCLGSSATAGIYYLSPTNPGKATNDPGNHLRQPLISYYGDGKFSLSLFYMAHDNHFHASEKVNAWTGTSSDDPDGYSYKFTPSTNLGEISEACTVIFNNGELQNVTSGAAFHIENNTLYSIEGGDNVILFNHFPFAYGSPVVRNISSTDDSLGVTNRNGLVTLAPAPWVVGTAKRSRVALSAISGRTINYTPVITDVTAGNGITVTHNADGSVRVHTGDRVGEPIDAYNINFNGTTMASTDNLTSYITFPAGRASASLAISLPVTGITAGSNLIAKVWGIVEGAGAAFDVLTKFTPHPSVDTQSIPAISSENAGTLSLNGENGRLTYAETTNGVAVAADGSLVAKITRPVAGAEIRLLRVGFRLVDQSSAQEDNSVALSEINGTVVGSGTALEDIPAQHCVYAATGGLRLCDASDINTLNKCVGVTLESVESGNITRYVTDGILQTTNALNCSGGRAVFIGISGGITQAPEYNNNNWAYVQQIGMALSPNAIVVNIKDGTVANDY